MNYERIGKTIMKKKSDPKNRKNSKNQSEIAACEIVACLSLAIRQIFDQKPFSHFTDGLKRFI